MLKQEGAIDEAAFMHEAMVNAAGWNNTYGYHLLIDRPYRSPEQIRADLVEARQRSEANQQMYDQQAFPPLNLFDQD